MRIAARLTSRDQDRIFYESTFRTTSKEDGEFVIGGLPQTEFVLSITDPKKRWVFRPREKLLILPDKPEMLTVRMEKGVLVTGRVSGPDGEPVVNAGFSAIADSPIGPGLSSDSTDADGCYEFILPAGNARLLFNSVPDGYVYPDPQIVKQLEIKPGQDAIEDLDFTLPTKDSTQGTNGRDSDLEIDTAVPAEEPAKAIVSFSNGRDGIDPRSTFIFFKVASPLQTRLVGNGTTAFVVVDGDALILTIASIRHTSTWVN